MFRRILNLFRKRRKPLSPFLEGWIDYETRLIFENAQKNVYDLMQRVQKRPYGDKTVKFRRYEPLSEAKNVS